MIDVPLAVVITQWVLLAALAVLVVVVYRQLAYLLRLSGAMARKEGGLGIGERAPAFSYRTTEPPIGGEMANGRFTAVGTPTLLLFTDPRCGACEQALVALESVTRTYRPDRMRVLAVTDADLVILRASEVFSATTVTVAQVDPKTMIHGYRAYVTPLFYGVDGSGIVRSKGAGADERAIRRVVRQLLAEDHAHASEQPVAGVPGEDQAAKAAAREGEYGELL